MAKILSHFVGVYGCDFSEGVGNGISKVTDINDGSFGGNGFDVLSR